VFICGFISVAGIICFSKTPVNFFQVGERFE